MFPTDTFVFQDLNIISNDSLTYRSPFHRAFPRCRILIWLTYWLDCRIYGKRADPWRRTNLLIHLINCLALCTISPLASLLLLVHPLSTSGHSYIAGRSGLLSATFQLVVVLAAIHGWWLGAGGIALLASYWLKEDSVVFFPMILVLWSAG